MALAPNTGSRNTPSVSATSRAAACPALGRAAARPDPAAPHVWPGEVSADPGQRGRRGSQLPDPALRTATGRLTVTPTT